MTPVFILRPAATVLITLLATACSNPQTSVYAPSQAIVLQPVERTAAKAVFADVGHGIRTSAQLKFQINLGQLTGFKTQADPSGTAAKTIADLNTIKFYLVASDTGTPPTALSGTGFSYDLTTANRTHGLVDITFTNVVANTPGQSYYVVAAGFDATPTTAANNITNLNAPITDATEGKYYVSTSGGSPAGAVSVSPVTYAISGTAALGVPLKLLDATP